MPVLNYETATRRLEIPQDADTCQDLVFGDTTFIMDDRGGALPTLTAINGVKGILGDQSYGWGWSTQDSVPVAQNTAIFLVFANLQSGLPNWGSTNTFYHNSGFDFGIEKDGDGLAYVDYAGLGDGNYIDANEQLTTFTDDIIVFGMISNENEGRFMSSVDGTVCLQSAPQAATSADVIDLAARNAFVLMGVYMFENVIVSEADATATMADMVTKYNSGVIPGVVPRTKARQTWPRPVAPSTPTVKKTLALPNDVSVPTTKAVSDGIAAVQAAMDAKPVLPNPQYLADGLQMKTAAGLWTTFTPDISLKPDAFRGLYSDGVTYAEGDLVAYANDSMWVSGRTTIGVAPGLYHNPTVAGYSYRGSSSYSSADYGFRQMFYQTQNYTFDTIRLAVSAIDKSKTYILDLYVADYGTQTPQGSKIASAVGEWSTSGSTYIRFNLRKNIAPYTYYIMEIREASGGTVNLKRQSGTSATSSGLQVLWKYAVLGSDLTTWTQQSTYYMGDVYLETGNTPWKAVAPGRPAPTYRDLPLHSRHRGEWDQSLIYAVGDIVSYRGGLHERAYTTGGSSTPGGTASATTTAATAALTASASSQGSLTSGGILTMSGIGFTSTTEFNQIILGTGLGAGGTSVVSVELYEDTFPAGTPYRKIRGKSEPIARGRGSGVNSDSTMTLRLDRSVSPVVGKTYTVVLLIDSWLTFGTVALAASGSLTATTVNLTATGATYDYDTGVSRWDHPDTLGRSDNSMSGTNVLPMSFVNSGEYWRTLVEAEGMTDRTTTLTAVTGNQNVTYTAKTSVMLSVTASAAGRIRLYKTTTGRTADAARASGEAYTGSDLVYEKTFTAGEVAYPEKVIISNGSALYAAIENATNLTVVYRRL